jgi:inorganic pyrophosphatase
MIVHQINAGDNAPESFNVVVEIPAQGAPIKYELDKRTGALFVDRFIATSMTYPCNYGFIPQTLSDDGDPVDVLVLTAVPVLPGSVIRARAIGLLRMSDEAGSDDKVLAVPIQKVSLLYDNVTNYTDIPDALLKSISHFFQHYKDLEPNKWVKIEGWAGVEAANKEIVNGIERYKSYETEVE